jgi:hypothetical protein
LIVVTVKYGVFFAVRTEFLNIQASFGFKGLKTARSIADANASQINTIMLHLATRFLTSDTQLPFWITNIKTQINKPKNFSSTATCSKAVSRG